jgi:nucleoside-diphosphate-sugar epimerase
MEPERPGTGPLGVSRHRPGRRRHNPATLSRCVVTGGGGCVGGFVLRELAGRHELVLVSRRPLETPHELVVGDLRSPADCDRAFAGADAVVHLAAIPEPSPETFEVNVMTTHNVLEAARRHGVRRVVMAGSNCAYGHGFRISDTPFRPRRLPIDETHPCEPEDGYSLSKLVCEEMLEAYRRAYGIDAAALRLNWVWGEPEHAWRASKRELDHTEQAEWFWAYVDGRDAARAFRLALEAPALPEELAYNVSAADTMAAEDSRELVERFLPASRHLAASLEGRESFFGWARARDVLGYEPQHSWRDAQEAA